MQNKSFNIRVYGLCIQDKNILVLDEMYAGLALSKFPGGGLEYGEGSLECLHREFLEELNVGIEIIGHFFTQETFLASRFRENEQILCIYYLVKILPTQPIKITDTNIHQAKWVSLEKENPMTLPTDKYVFDKLKSQLENFI